MGATTGVIEKALRVGSALRPSLSCAIVCDFSRFDAILFVTPEYNRSIPAR